MLQDHLMNNDIFSCIEGFDDPIVRKCHNGNALQTVHAVVLRGDLLFILDCTRWFVVCASRVGLRIMWLAN